MKIEDGRDAAGGGAGRGRGKAKHAFFPYETKHAFYAVPIRVKACFLMESEDA